MYSPDKIDTGAGILLMVVVLANNGRGVVIALCVALFVAQYATRHSRAICDGWRALGVQDGPIARFFLPGIAEEAPLLPLPTRRVMAQEASGQTAHISIPLEDAIAQAAPVVAPPSYDATAAWLAAAQQQTPTHAQLSLAQALAHLNDRPDDVPHFFCLGGTGAGKSTFARLVLAQRVQRGEQFLILTGKRTMLFADLPCVGRDPIGPNGEIRFLACRAACRALLTEVARRDAVPVAQRAFTPLTIVLDDASILLSEANEAAEVVRVVGLLGRELAMRLMILTGSLLLKELNLEGRGDLRDHFAVVDYHKRLDGSRQTEIRLRYSEKDTYPFDADRVPQIAPGLKIDPALCWRPVSTVSPQGVPPVPVRAGAIPPASTGTDQYGTSGTFGNETPQTGGTALPMDEDAIAIRNLLQQMGSKNKVAAFLGGSKSTAYDRIDRALGER